MTPTLLVAAALRGVAAGIYVAIGRKLTRRPVGPESALALRLFGVWWYGLAAIAALQAIPLVLAAGGWLDLPMMLALATVQVLAICVALWGLLYYLAFLFTGQRRILVPITGFYAAFAFLLFYLVAWGAPASLDVGAWSVRTVPTREPSGAVVGAFLVLLLAPHIVGAAAYAGLWFRAETRTQRFRIGTLAAAVIVIFGSPALASVLGASEAPWWPWVSQLITVVASLVILGAYHPPQWARRRWGVVAVDQPEPEARAD